MRPPSPAEMDERVALVGRVMDATATADDAADAVSALLSATCAYIRTAPSEQRLGRAEEAARLILADARRSFN